MLSSRRDFLYSEIASYKKFGNNVLASSLSKVSNSSIDTFKLLDIANKVLPEQSKMLVLPEAISAKVVFGIPLF